MTEENKDERLKSDDIDKSLEGDSSEEIETSEQEIVDVDNETSENDEATDELTVLQTQNSELEDKVLRLQAEISNIQRRNTLDRQSSAKYRSQNLATELLDVVDNLERALAIEVQSDDAKALKEGVEMVYNRFVSVFEKENIKVINPLNEEFDPNFHQAVSMMAAQEGQASNSVINVLQKGYILEDRVIRPAMVIVAE